MPKSIRILFLFFLIEPFVSYAIYPIYASDFFAFFTTLVFLIFIISSQKTLIFKKEDLIICFYFIYLVGWSLINGKVISIYHPTSLLHFIFSYLFIQIPILRILLRNIIIDYNFIKLSTTAIKVMIILGLIVSIVQVFQIDFLLPSDSAIQPEDYNDAAGSFDRDIIHTSRRPSIFGYYDSNALGFSFLPFFSVFIGNVILKKKIIILEYVLLFSALGICILSNSRYITFGCFLVLSQFLFFGRRDLSSVLRFIVIVFLAVCFMYYFIEFLGYSLDTYFEERLLSDSSNKSRMDAYSTFLIFFPEYWLFGSGVHINSEMIRATGGVESIHIGYLSHLIEFGVIGTLLLLWYYYEIVHSVYLNARKSGYSGAFFAFVVFVWANLSLVNYSFFYPGFVIALIYDKYSSQITSITTK